MAARKAASVLPEPVGAKISVERPAWISGQPSSCARVGPENVSANHSATAGWKRKAAGRGMTSPDYRDACPVRVRMEHAPRVVSSLPGLPPEACAAVSMIHWGPLAGLSLLLALPMQEPAPAPSPAAQATPEPVETPLSPEKMKERERNVLLTVSTVLLGQRTYASYNASFFDEIACLTNPASCIPGFASDGAPFLDPTYAWLEPRLGYARKFHPGPKVAPEAIAKAKASPSSLHAFAFTATPVKPGVTGGRAF